MLNSPLEQWNQLENKTIELQTLKQKKWFIAVSDGDYILIRPSDKSPSVQLKMNRNISFEEFEIVVQAYDSFLEGIITREELNNVSFNEAYVLALIEHLKSGDNK